MCSFYSHLQRYFYAILTWITREICFADIIINIHENHSHHHCALVPYHCPRAVIDRLRGVKSRSSPNSTSPGCSRTTTGFSFFIAWGQTSIQVGYQRFKTVPVRSVGGSSSVTLSVSLYSREEGECETNGEVLQEGESLSGG